MFSPRSITTARSRQVSSRRRGSRNTPLLRRLGGVGSLIVACLASPCCAPLLVPGLLALFAGTPLAVFLAQYLGWVYAGLTVLSLGSLYLGWRWISRKNATAFSQDTGTSSGVCQENCPCKEEQS
jgi:hypothetical protein